MYDAKLSVRLECFSKEVTLNLNLPEEEENKRQHSFQQRIAWLFFSSTENVMQYVKVVCFAIQGLKPVFAPLIFMLRSSHCSAQSFE